MEWGVLSPDALRRRHRLAEAMVHRRADWRVGPVTYQIFVDRFAPSANIEAKRHHYAAPRRLRTWDELPAYTGYHAEERISHGEMDFWGGDIAGIRSRVDYIQQLGVELLYLNPIFSAFSNHKYDGNDYKTVDPQFGTFEDVKALAADLHGRGMRLMLDGVFNHLGRRSPMFQRASQDPASPERDWFHFHQEHRHGYRAWRNSANLPEINLEHDEVRRLVYDGPDSAVRYWIREAGIDGWRLDVAPDLGFEHLAGITQAAHEEKPGSAVIGECWNYPEEWLEVLDGIMNMHTRMLILAMLEGRISAGHTGHLLERMIDDAGIEGMLRCHLVLDNHDLPRLATVLPDESLRRLALLLLFTLPGAPVIYYGSELGMLGGNDPANRAPMRWDLDTPDNPTLELVKRLLAMRRDNPALRYGDWRRCSTERLLAFLRITDRSRETVIVVVNPSGEERSELVPIRDSRLMDAAKVGCMLTGEEHAMHCGTIQLTLPPRSARVFRTLDQGASQYGYSAFKRMP